MISSQMIKTFLKEKESLRLVGYRDPVGVITNGWGHTKTAKLGEVITLSKAESLFSADVNEAERGVSRLVKVALKQNQFDALVSFVFNVGSGNLQKSTLLKKLNALDFAGAGNEFLKWDKAGCATASGCRRLSGLTKRRIDEKQIFDGGTNFGFPLSIFAFLLFGYLAYKNI